MSFESVDLTFQEQRIPSLEAILEACGTKMFIPAKQAISHPGDSLKSIYYLEKGCTQHYITNSDGSIKLLYTLRPGWLFGESPLYLNLPTNLLSRTKEDSTIITISDDVFHNQLIHNNEFVSLLMRCYSHKVLTLRYEIENLCFNSCKERVKRLFCASVESSIKIDDEWYPLRVKYTQSEMETIISSSRVSINKTINCLIAEGFLRIVNHQIQVNAEKYSMYLDNISDNVDIL